MTAIPLSRTLAPDTRGPRAVGWFLVGMAAMVAVMVVLGGVTRLTESGLSMVSWRPVTGWLPPLSAAEWEQAFAAYKASPEFQKVNFWMRVEDFRQIFWMEYLHRLWGRLIGLAFAGGLVWFALRHRLPRGLWARLIGLFVLGGMQGVLGWVMVQSGLVDRPDVSHYRLAAHLSLAFVIYGALLWTAFGLLATRAGPARRTGCAAGLVLALVSVTVIVGALVAGLDAGHAYNSFPLMNGHLVPPEAFSLSPWLINFVENTAAVQFLHRCLATVTVIAVAVLWLRARSTADAGPASLVMLAVLIQFALGVTTLLTEVSIPVAAVHQAGALVLFTAALWAVWRAGGAAQPA